MLPAAEQTTAKFKFAIYYEIEGEIWSPEDSNSDLFELNEKAAGAGVMVVSRLIHSILLGLDLNGRHGKIVRAVD